MCAETTSLHPYQDFVICSSKASGAAPALPASARWHHDDIGSNCADEHLRRRRDDRRRFFPALSRDWSERACGNSGREQTSLLERVCSIAGRRCGDGDRLKILVYLWHSEMVARFQEPVAAMLLRHRLDFDTDYNTYRGVRIFL